MFKNIIKCTKYKTVKKCKSYIILNDNKVIKYENKHTHPGKEYDESVSIVRYKMKNEIRKISIPFDINPKHIYNKISEEIGLICSEYKLFIKYNENMFADGTFYNATIFGYQVFIIRLPPKILHYDFEKGISNAAIKIFSNITIKYYIWHYKRSLKTYLYKYNIQYWNYYNDINQITNNASELFNNYLKKLFYKKPSFYELIYHLKREESLSYNNYKRKIEGESELIDKKCDKNDIIDLWYKCLLELNKH
ncbi:hypothetical protein H8356DRAFT_1359757 [Neocallimastix lanati (nom. inval.)]|nr:hypothetical protein H8356DRAFT_1359757 [Neocallimastix sp. JGI-2020a]